MLTYNTFSLTPFLITAAKNVDYVGATARDAVKDSV